VHLNLEEAALPVVEDEPEHVAPELDLVELPLFSQTEPLEWRSAGEPARIGGADRGAQGGILDRLVALEIEPADDAKRVLSDERSTEHDKARDEAEQA